MLSSKKEMGFHRPLYVFGGTMITSQICSFLSFRGTHHVLLLCIITGEYPEKRRENCSAFEACTCGIGKVVIFLLCHTAFPSLLKKSNQIILVVSVCKDDIDCLHSRQNNYIFRHSVCIKKRTYFVRFLFYLCLFFVISYFPLLQLL